MFEGEMFYLSWPLLILVFAFCFTVGGFWRHWRSGLHQFSPWSAGMAVVALVVLIGIILNETAADWSCGWCILAGLIIVGSGFILMRGYLGYSELWREFFNSQVLSCVVGTLQDGRFQDRYRNLASGRACRAEWGSVHCLRIVQGYYDTMKQRVLMPIASETEDEATDRFVAAGLALRSYLSVRWSEELLPPAEQRARILELVRELVTVCLIAQESVQENYQGKIAAWRKELQQPGDLYHQLLDEILALGVRARTPLTPIEAGTKIGDIIHLFDQLESQGSAPALGLDMRNICANTWLALAHHSIPGQACFDAWMAMCDAQNEDLFVRPAPTGELDPAQVAARRYLADWYDLWRDRTPAGWQEGLAGRAEYARVVAPSS
ncbi:MAG: hypothetical protein JXM73_17110 [Anaerolineae bacterium]|nr:hypothetical protein [Anaerolineae bacterium]